MIADLHPGTVPNPFWPFVPTVVPAMLYRSEWALVKWRERRFVIAHRPSNTYWPAAFETREAAAAALAQMDRLRNDWSTLPTRDEADALRPFIVRICRACGWDGEEVSQAKAPVFAPGD